MKLLSSASLAGVFAASLANAQGSGAHAPFSVTRLSAGATPHSSYGYVELNWSYSGGLNQTTCSVRPATYQTFPFVEKTVCSDSSTFFSLTPGGEDGGASLQLWHQTAPAVSVYGVHAISADEIIWTNQQSPTGTVQVYAGPQNFTVEAVYPDGM